MRKDFPVSNAGINDAFDFISQTTSHHGVDASLASRASIIVDEICSNMIRHDESLTEDSCFTLELMPNESGMTMVITDGGRPFNPLDHRHDAPPEIGGHGISLIRGLSSSIAYDRVGTRNRLTVMIAASED